MGEGYIGFTSVKDALPVEFGIQEAHPSQK
jgi:hypothetical protein